MSPGNTTSGLVLESMILPALQKGGYTVKTQVHIGARFNGGKHFADAVAEKGDRRILLSVKWHLVNHDKATIITLEAFIALANKSKL